MTTKKNLHFSIPLFGLLVIGIVSCNNPDTNGQNSNTAVEKNEQSGKSQSEPKTFFLGDGKFAHLAIHKDSLENFFFTNPPQGLNSKKMVFRFAHDGNSTSPLKIDGFLTRSNNNNFLDRPPVILDSCINGASDLSGQKIYLADLELTKKQYIDHIRPAMGNNTFLAFYPHIVTTGPVQYCITYRMMWIADCQAFAPPKVQIAGYDPESDLNPCPPNQPGN
jgi:hypothetical protein